MDGRKILFLATVDSHIYYFHIPFMELLRDMGYGVEVAAAPVGFKERIEKEGFKVYPVPFSRNPLSFQNFKAFFMLLNLMKKRKYIMVHTHTPVASFLGRIVAKVVGVSHIVYTVHGFHFHEHGNRFKNFIYYRLEKFAGKFTDVLITINTDDYKVARDKNIIPNGKVFYVKGVGIDIYKFSSKKFDKNLGNIYRNRLGINKGDLIIITIAELIKNKNIYDIIDAISFLNGRIELIVVGDGALRDKLKSYVKIKKLLQKVLFLGRRFDIPELLYTSDIFVMTSFREGLPKSAMEAMAMSKPVVAYDIRGLRDLVVDGETGFLVPFRDINKLAEKILFLYEHPDVCRKMGENGRERIEKEFSLNVVMEQMKKLYSEILAE